MGITETTTRPTRRSLINKSKDDLVTLVLQLIEINAQFQDDVDRLAAEAELANWNNLTERQKDEAIRKACG